MLNVAVNFEVNLNLPQFSQLQFPGNAVRVDGQGNDGVILFRAGSNNLVAYDGADPNLPLSSCSRLEIDGQNVKSSCTNPNEYELFTGQIIGANPQPCTLLRYRVENIGNDRFLVTN